jgi:hypothetical protein
MSVKKYYVEAFDKYGKIISGNTDGQCVIYACHLRKTEDYKALKRGFFRSTVCFHEIQDANTRAVVETILQNEFKSIGKKILEKEIVNEL